MNLTSDNFLSEGKFRKVYIHPDDPNLCVKLGKPLLHKRALKRELYYLKRHQDSLSFITPLRGTVDSNLGLGYIFDLVRNYDGSISDTLENEVATLDSSVLSEKLHEMYQELLLKRAAVGDFHARNILIRWVSKTNYELWIIDGFGNSDYLKFCDYSKYLLNKKLVRKFNKLCKRIDHTQTFD